MATRRTTQERIDDLRAKAKKLEVQAREQRKADAAAKDKRLAALIHRAGIQDEDENVILGALIKTRNALKNPSTGDRYKNELLGIAEFGDPAALDNLIEGATLSMRPAVGTDNGILLKDAGGNILKPAPVAAFQRPPAGTLVDEAPGTISTYDAALYTGWSAATLVHAVKEGRLYGVRVPYRQTSAWRFEKSDLDAFKKPRRRRFQ